MFISQGPLGSLQAGILCWVSSVTVIGWEISPVTFPPHFSQILSLWRSEKAPLSGAHNMCLSPRVPEPRGHTSGPSTHDICHCLHHVTSIFCKQVSLASLEEQTLLLSPVLSRASLSLLSLTSASLPLVSRLHICHHLCLIALKLKWYYDKAQYTKIHLELSCKHLRVLNFPPELFTFTLSIWDQMTW